LGYKLRTEKEQLRLKIIEKLRTANLNSEFTGPYKKCIFIDLWMVYFHLLLRPDYCMEHFDSATITLIFAHN